MTEGKIIHITEHLHETVQKHGDKITYDEFEESIKIFNNSMTVKQK